MTRKAEDQAETECCSDFVNCKATRADLTRADSGFVTQAAKASIICCPSLLADKRFPAAPHNEARLVWATGLAHPAGA